MHFWDSIRWRIFTYYTTLIAAMLALLISLHAMSVHRTLDRAEVGRLRSAAVALMPVYFPPPSFGPDGAAQHKEPVRPNLQSVSDLNPTVRQALEVASSEDSFYVAYDRQGGIAGRSDDAPVDALGGDKLSNLQQLASASVGNYLAVIAKTPSGERLVVGVSRQNLRAKFLGQLFVAVLIGVAVLTVASALGFWTITRCLRPIASISETARRIAAGELSGRIDVRSQRSELGQLARTLNETFDRLSGALQRQVQFTADASHELRTPIAAIVADCQFSLKKERPPERYRETIEVCHESAQHMRLLIERLSLLARFDAHDSVLQKDAIDLKEVGECALAVVGPVAEEKGIRIDTNLGSAEVTADRLRLEQVVINLTTNAVRYNKPGGTVTIRSGRIGAKVFLEVSDTGIGIPADMLEKVFDRFFRVEDSRNSSTGGTGLGLAICKSIVEAHGGSVTVQSELGLGSTFRIEFPRK